MTDQHRATPEQWKVVEICSEEGKIPWPTADCILELRDTIRALCKARNDLVVCSTEQNQRIEALEAAQPEQAESHRFCVDAIVRRVEALEARDKKQQADQKPPLGLMPRWLADEKRLGDLDAALQRYRGAYLDPPGEWLWERQDLLDNLRRHRPAEAATVKESLAAPSAPTTPLFSYKVGKAEPIEDWGKGHTPVNPKASMAELRAASAEAQPAGGLVERVAAAIDRAPFDEGLHQWDEASAAIREVATWLDRFALHGSGEYAQAAKVLRQEANHD
jgi:hypothetical protein